MRSRGLFHKAVIITESDSDRAFYDEINRRLVEVGRGIDDSLFLNAQNWQTIPRLAGPLRKLGIPAVAIMDFDALSVDQTWPDIFDMLNLPPTERRALENSRSKSKGYLDAIPVPAGSKKPFKTKGVDALSGQERTDTVALLDLLGSYGVFLVPIGELECWLRPQAIPAGRKNEWLVNAFKIMGSDPRDPSYLKPTIGDVWDFIDKLAKWTNDPARKGIP